jgi:outer membrane biosynthesis protein TonB
VIEVKPSETRPVYAALALSLVLHAFIAWFNPSLWAHLTQPEMDTIVVELLREDEGKPTPTPKSDTELAKKSAEQTRSEKASPPLQVEAAPPSSAGIKGEAQPEPLKLKADAKPLEPEEAIKLTSTHPDPTSDIAKEATMSLDDPDERYRGFLDNIRAAINKKWNAREAMLTARRSGLASVKFTLSAGGGNADAPALIAQSGSEVLDGEALRAVQAANFPAFPDSWVIRRLNLIGEFEYAIAGM